METIRKTVTNQQCPLFARMNFLCVLQGKFYGFLFPYYVKHPEINKERNAFNARDSSGSSASISPSKGPAASSRRHRDVVVSLH